MNTTIILNREDVNNPLHPNLWEDFMETLGLDPETTEVCLDKSKHDDNKIIKTEIFKNEDRVTLSNNTTIVCGVITSIGFTDGNKNSYYVEWDDVVYSGREIIRNWYDEGELVKI